MRQIRALKLEELYFIFDPPGIPGQAAVHPDDAVTRDDNGNRIVPHGAADRLAGHALPAHPGGCAPRQLAIGCICTIGNFAQQRPDNPAEFAAFRYKRKA